MSDPDDLPKSPSGRVPQWVVEERLMGRRPDTTFRPPPAGGRSPRRRLAWRRSTVVVVGLLAVLGLVGAGVLGSGIVTGLRLASSDGATPSGTSPASASAASSVPSSSVPSSPVPSSRAGVLLDMPRPGVDARPARVLPPVEPPRRSASWRAGFYQADAKGGRTTTPVRWDPCRPVRYVVNPAGAPPGGAALIEEGFRAVSRASGLQFVAAGTTDEVVPPSGKRSLLQRDRYGDRWAPVLVSWVDPDAAGPAAVDAASQVESVVLEGRPAVLVSGLVRMDAPYLRRTLRDGDRAAARAWTLGVMAGVTGLALVDDPAQLLASRPTGDVLDFAAGDRTGLSEMGKGPCAPWL